MKASIRSKQGYRAPGSDRASWHHLLIAGGLAAGTLLAGCGGGGSGDGTPLVVQTPPRPILASNAEAAFKLTLEMMDLTDALTSTWGLGAGINETRCSSGSGIGTVTNCVIGDSTFNGSVSTNITQTQTLTLPGDSSSRSIAATQSLAISNLQWQSTKNRATYTVNGNLLQTYTYPLYQGGPGAATVTGTLTLTDVATGIRYQYRNLSQRYSLAEDASLRGYAFTQTDRGGAVVYMNEDLQYQMSSGLFDYLSLAGFNARLSIVEDNANYSLTIDSDNDGLFDIFASIPAAEIGNGHITSNAAPTITVSRQGGNSTPIIKDLPITLNASINDADHNFHTVSWAITSAPAAATGDSAAKLTAAGQGTTVQSFSASVAGSYVVTATTTETGVNSAPASASAQITLRVAMNAPTVDVVGLNNAIGEVGVARSFPITQQNLEGTITTTLLSAPAGMTLVGNQLSWVPQRQFFPGTTETVTLRVGNEDQATTKTFAVTVNDPGAAVPRTTPGIAINDFNTDATLINVHADATSELLMAGSSSAFFGLSLSTATPTAVVANPYAFSIDATTLTAVKPVRTAGVVSAYAVASARGVFIIDATTHALLSSRGLQFNPTVTTWKRRIAVADVNGDGNDEVLALTSTVGNSNADQLFVLNQQNLSTQASTQPRALGQEFLVGDVDGNGDLEIVCGNGVILKAATLATVADAGVLAGGLNYVLANVDADSQQEIIEVSASSIAVVDVETAARTNITASGFNADTLDLFALNADGDAQDELLVGSTSNQVQVYSIDKTGPTATLDRTLGTAASGNTVREVMLGNVTGDASNEVVFVSRNGASGGAMVSVAALDGSLLIDGTVQTLAVGSFAAARAQNPVAESGFFTASTLRNGAAGKGALAVDASTSPVFLALDVPVDTGLFAASADIDGNSSQDLLASTRLRADSDMSIFAQLTGVSNWQLPISAGTPAPVAIAQMDGGGDLEAVYIERSGALGNEAVSLVVQAVNGAEITRLTLQSSGPISADPVALAAANLDGDADPDVVLLEANGVRTFEYSGGSLQPSGAVSISGTQRALAVGDANGDGLDDIAVVRSGVNNDIRLYSPTLTLTTEAALTQPTTALAFYTAAGMQPQWLTGNGSRIAAFDAQSLTQLWLSPSLHGQVNSVDVLTTSGGAQLRAGTENALYRSQP